MRVDVIRTMRKSVQRCQGEQPVVLPNLMTQVLLCQSLVVGVLQRLKLLVLCGCSKSLTGLISAELFMLN